MSNEYRSVKMKDTTFFNLNYLIRQLFYQQGVRLTKVQAMDIAVNRLGEAIIKAQDKTNSKSNDRGR
ncbi:hypothetical protein O71_18261 [Pontibacter sp. BAB1700]|nr:hypothetical protein O71_18261 [Pontibacter sp. BAB1700]